LSKLLNHPLARIVLAGLLGALGVLGFAPFYFYPATIVALAGLFYLWHRASSPKETAWLGFVFGLGYFIAGIYWIYISLHTFGGMPPLGAAFATFCLCAFVSLFPAAVGWLGKRSGVLLISAPLLWALAEWVRSWIFTGFPWLTVGYSQVPNGPLAGFAPIIGIYGVSLVLALFAALLTAMVADWGNKTLRRSLILSLILLWVSGSLLKMVAWSEPQGEPISVALLQGNITQDLKWQEGELERTMDKYLAMVEETSAKLIVLPETALPMLAQQIPGEYLLALQNHAKANQGDLLLGAVEFENDQFYNSMLSVGSSPMQAYRKSHLVPFGEFIPLKQVFGWVYRDWLNIPLTDLSPGGFDQRPIAVAGQKVAVNICYEDVFGEEIILQLPEATLLVNTSNDAWYGESLAAYQHLQMSQARALETGRMMLRATNTGATAIIDHRGELVAHAPHFATETLTGDAQGYTGSTPYVRLGNWPFILFSIGMLGLLWGRKKK
jgi:apolipoprotein N-acyltransferase